mmetsp:Transcript_4549/g.13768  ORF Transcript_4549/g.13768 Transcript_4549/m.13768 type:complete len:213 (+) Transcript_4549:2239-2877(+)
MTVTTESARLHCCSRRASSSLTISGQAVTDGMCPSASRVELASAGQDRRVARSAPTRRARRSAQAARPRLAPRVLLAQPPSRHQAPSSATWPRRSRCLPIAAPPPRCPASRSQRRRRPRRHGVAAQSRRPSRQDWHSGARQLRGRLKALIRPRKSPATRRAPSFTWGLTGSSSACMIRTISTIRPSLSSSQPRLFTCGWVLMLRWTSRPRAS